ncbi:MAG: hypothetical protein O9297_06745 [Flavobacterium sp.]|uniref:hypothetical protein n=1 Tax=Flavobacterium sp. TaxID=239 RepID=UPI0022C4F3C1|nr:hypothetical protein [Flavobacterium sp.]MCZ8296901.1 hypothetical protein [Flavobacterium sp.]
MKRILLTFISILFLNNKSYSQSNDTEALLYNISIGGVFGTIGAILNKKPNEKLDKIIFKGFSQGSLGGYLTFESKRVLRLGTENEDWKLIWAAKLLNAGGVSIKDNAAHNQDFWDKWHINIGFNRLEFETKNKFKMNYKIMPVALVYNTLAFTLAKFDFNTSIKTGEFIFQSDDKRLYDAGTRGVTFPGLIALSKEGNNFNTITHEIIHIYQSNDFSILNSIYAKPLKKIESKYNFINKINNHIYYDFHYLPLRLLYNFETKNANKYFDNYLEHEAGYFSNTLH